MKIKKLVAAMALSVSSVAAFAVAPATVFQPGTDFGTLDLSSGPFSANIAGSHTAGSFTDYFYLSLTEPTNLIGQLSAATFAFNNVTYLEITGLTLGLSGPNLTELMVSPDPFVASGVNVQAGDYTVTITGNATGVFGGTYAGVFSATTAPVPEPESYAMLLVGLGLMGAIARKRSKENV